MSDFETSPGADRFLGGRLHLRQAPGGHRAGADAVLLAAAAPRDASGLALDIGAGVGAVGLALALFSPRARVGLVEIDPQACELARQNIAANRLGDRVFVHAADVVSAASRRAAGLAEEKAELVLTNPPFYEAGRLRVSPDSQKALAHVAKQPLGAWVRACLALLRPGGIFVMIHRADALSECLASVEGRLGGVAILPVAPREGEAAVRILLRGKKGSKAPLSLLAPLVLHEADGRFTERAEAIFRGGAGVVW